MSSYDWFIDTENLPVMKIVTPRNVKMCAIFGRSFAYFTVKERLPIIITKIIDQLSRDRVSITERYGAVSDGDVRSAMSYLVQLRNEIMTNKPIALLTSDAADVQMWNNLIKEHNHPYYFTAVWLFTECYVYRRIKEAFELTSEMKLFDPFRKQKEQQFVNSIESMCYVADQMVSTWLAIGRGAKMSDYFLSLLKICLWSNKCDLSLSAGAEVVQKQNPISVITTWDENIIINDFDKLFGYMRNASMVMQQFEEVRQKIQAQEKRDEEHRKHEAERKALEETALSPTPKDSSVAPNQNVVVATVQIDSSNITNVVTGMETQDERTIASFDSSENMSRTLFEEEANLAVSGESTEEQTDIRSNSGAIMQDQQVPESDGPIDSEPDMVSASVPGNSITSNVDDFAETTSSQTGRNDTDRFSSVSGLDTPEMEEPLKLKKPLPHVMIDIICDNAGYELFADLCLADFLITKGFCSKVRFRLKAYPWFVSDATLRDFEWTIKFCSLTKFSKFIGKPGTETTDDSSDSVDIRKKQDDHLATKYLKSDNLIKLGTRWKKYCVDGLFEPVVDEFWTTSYDYSQMRKVDPFLYKSLGDAIFIFFKGDLNYRKLMGENNWNPTTSFTKALQGFHPSPVCAIRTVKADLICGLKEGEMAKMMAKDEKWMETGDYGLIQACNKVSRISTEELTPDTEDA